MTSSGRRPASMWAAFTATVDAAPSAIAISTSDGAQTFEQVASCADHVRSALAGYGFGPGSMVHLALPNAQEFLPAVLALRSIGATVGLVSSRYRDAELRAVIERIRPHAFLTTPQFAGIIERSIDVSQVLPVPPIKGQGDLVLVIPDMPPEPAEAVDRLRGIALIKFTSGSTGAPKGVGLTEANLRAEADNLIRTLHITSADRIVVPVPVSHSYGFDLGLLPVVFAGSQAVLRRSFIPREVFADLANPDSSVFLGVPSMYRVLAEADPASLPDLSHVRHALSCTAPLLPSLVELCHLRLGIAVCQHYGSSETGAAANHRADAVLGRPASVGVALDGVRVRVIDEQGHTQAAGREGEIAIRSRAVARGYVTDESNGTGGTFATDEEGVTEYRTGDIGLIDESGFIFWRGRRDQVINVGGLKVYPSEVVQVLERCPEVSGARVFAVRDPDGEEVVHAVVTLSQSTREQDILAHCRRYLADYKVPRRVVITDSITTPEAEKLRNLTGVIS